VPKKDKKTLPVSVTLSGDDLDKFLVVKKKFEKEHYLGTDAELLRMCLRYYVDRYGQNQDLNSNVQKILQRLDKLENRFSRIEERVS